MQHNAAFHQGLHCLLILKDSSEIEMYHNSENSTCDPVKNAMGSRYLLYLIQFIWENHSEYKGLRTTVKVLYVAHLKEFCVAEAIFMFGGGQN